MGKIADNKTRTLITIEKELKTDLEQIAKKQNRSFNNLVITVLKDYANSSHD
jgi:predicted HicB family RNase H-like nuclease